MSFGLDRLSIRWRLALTSAVLTFLILSAFALVIAQLTALSIGTVDMLAPGSPRSRAPEPPKGSGGGSVAPTGTLLQDLLGPGSDPKLERERKAGLQALRRRASQGSQGLPADEPALDYLLGGSE